MLMVGAEQQAAIVKTSKFFEIKIKIEKSCYLPGEQVNGIVIMHIIEPFSLKNFKVKFICLEEA